MTGRPGRTALPPAIDAALREFINALGKSAMYPAGHQFVTVAGAALTERVRAAIGDRESLTLGVTPRGLLIDGVAFDHLPSYCRDLASRLHRKNIGTIHFSDGLTFEDISAMLEAISRADADETVGLHGLRRLHLRVEPLSYDVLAFATADVDQELDEVFWTQFVEAAFGRSLLDGEGVPTVPQIVEAISERAVEADGAKRVFEALTSFASAIAAKGERGGGNARRRFVDVLAALSRPTTVKVVGAAPSPQSRRRFLRDTLQLVPPALLLQLLEVVAEADGEPISPQLRWMLGKLAGDGGESTGPSASGFGHQILGLIEQWDGGATVEDELTDPRLGLEPARVLAAGLDLGLSHPSIVDAARRLAARGQYLEVLQLIDHEQNDPAIVRVIADAVLDAGLLERLLSATPIDFPLIERVSKQSGADAVTPLLNALGSSGDRTTRRRILDLLVKVAEGTEETLVARIQGAPWFLVRNILVVLGQVPKLQHADRILPLLRDEEPRVRQEALKVLLRQPNPLRDRVIASVLEGQDASMVRSALAALGDDCPSRLVGPVAAVLGSDDEELCLLALRVLSNVKNPLIVPHLLSHVRTQRGLLRRVRLKSTSPLMLRALEILAEQWNTHRQANPVLQLAARSSDSAVRAAVGGAA